jgi:hypothetical protein
MCHSSATQFKMNDKQIDSNDQRWVRLRITLKIGLVPENAHFFVDDDLFDAADLFAFLLFVLVDLLAFPDDAFAVAPACLLPALDVVPRPPVDAVTFCELTGVVDVFVAADFSVLGE